MVQNENHQPDNTRIIPSPHHSAHNKTVKILPKTVGILYSFRPFLNIISLIYL